MRTFWHALLVVAAMFLMAVLKSLVTPPSTEQQLQPLIDASLSRIPAELLQYQRMQGSVRFHGENRSISDQQINAYLQEKIPELTDRMAPFSWYNKQRQHATMSASGEDHRHYFANGFLVGIRPFAVENNWTPLYVLAMRKTYQLDATQYHYTDIWQSSARAYVNLRGDCEDHALALADWLISEGMDARVVLGTVKDGGGHAWVVVFHEGQQFLLEATSKRRTKAWRHYPLVDFVDGYYPTHMFNRDTFWVLTDKTVQKNYADQAWQIRSTFTRNTSEDI